MSTRADAQSWTDFPVLLEMEFGDKVDRYAEIVDTITALEAEKKLLSADIEAALIVAEQRRVEIDDDHVMEDCNGGTASRIDAKLLASKGVAADVITACTVPGKKYTYVQLVDLRKQKGGMPAD